MADMIYFAYKQDFVIKNIVRIHQMKSNVNSYDYEITFDILNQMNEFRVMNAFLRTILQICKNKLDSFRGRN
ncbi:hypothetical protein ACPWSR_16905 [Alloiococcus sp. CFN-8]|uniref:hypothetical protein n=1 Tax=Alloiococcus sp. CFN-8 TaxID=3416081 RepID=UPI003CF94A49